MLCFCRDVRDPNLVAASVTKRLLSSVYIEHVQRVNNDNVDFVPVNGKPLCNQNVTSSNSRNPELNGSTLLSPPTSVFKCNPQMGVIGLLKVETEVKSLVLWSQENQLTKTKTPSVNQHRVNGRNFDILHSN